MGTNLEMLVEASAKIAEKVPSPSCYNGKPVEQVFRNLQDLNISQCELSDLVTTDEVVSASETIQQLTTPRAIPLSVIDDYEGTKLDGDIREIAQRRVKRGIILPLNLGWALSKAWNHLSKKGGSREYLSGVDKLERVLRDKEAYSVFLRELETYVNSTTFPGRNKAVLPYIKQRLDGENRALLIDIACSNMWFAREVNKNMKNVEVVGSDIYRVEPVKGAEKLRFIEQDITEQDLDWQGLEGKADVVTCFYLLNHYLSKEAGERAIFNMARALKNNGIIIAGYENTHPFIPYARPYYRYLVIEKRANPSPLRVVDEIGPPLKQRPPPGF